MDIFEKIGSVASETYKYTTEKTSRIARETKTKMKISEYKSKIEDLYTEIGKKVYEQHIREEKTNIDEEIAQICKQIDELTNKIAKAKEEVLHLKDKKQCPNCYSEIDKDSNYCSNCGAEQEKNEEEREDDIKEKTDTDNTIDNLQNSDNN